jgi:hypothetical protein
MLNGETANEFDARVERLWKTLDASSRGYLDLSGLKKGLEKMDHRACFSGVLDTIGAHSLTTVYSP